VKHQIRLATLQDVPPLSAIERAACALFLEVESTAGLPLALTPPDDFYEAQRRGLLWVALSEEGAPVGFALVEMFGETAHLEELDVLPEDGRRGIGTALVRAVCDWAATCGVTAVTLCTFRDVPWNAPFYARLGFRTLTAEELTPTLRARVEEERAHGLPAEVRVVMRYDIKRRGSPEGVQ
jgi:GNAT superfamily N-acetyltransferase